MTQLPGDRGETATARSWTIGDLPPLSGCTYVVTGGTGGVGGAATEALAVAGARVVAGVRDHDRGEEVLSSVRRAHPGADVRVAPLDLGDASSIADFAVELAETVPSLDGLLNVAGVMATPRGTTSDGVETQFGVNHLGHFALTGRLLPLLRQVDGSRVVTVSSGSHRGAQLDLGMTSGVGRYRRWKAYGSSKLANLLFAYELQRRADRAGLRLASMGVSPGAVRTRLGRHGVLQGAALAVMVPVVTRLRGLQPEEGAATTLRAALDESLRGGTYLEPEHETRGRPVERRSSDDSYDETLAARLWTESVALTGVDFQGL